MQKYFKCTKKRSQRDPNHNRSPGLVSFDQLAPTTNEALFLLVATWGEMNTCTCSYTLYLEHPIYEAHIPRLLQSQFTPSCICRLGTIVDRVSESNHQQFTCSKTPAFSSLALLYRVLGSGNYKSHIRDVLSAVFAVSAFFSHDNAV